MSDTGLLKPTLLLMTLLLGACSATVVDIEGSYPSPQVNTLPLTVGIYYDEDLLGFSYTEMDDSSGKEQYIVNSGNAQRELFNTLGGGIFEEVVALDSLDDVPGNHPEVDAVFVPLIEEFQLGLPEKTQLNSYEVWIKYNMRLSEPDGEKIADWSMTAYGKSPDQFSSKAGINSATNQALRDLAASFALNARDVPEIRRWLDRQGLSPTQ